MVQILTPKAKPHKPSFMERLGIGVANAGQTAARVIPEYMQKQQEKKAISSLYGEQVGNLPTNLQQEYSKFALAKEQKKLEKASELAANDVLLRQLERDRGLAPNSLAAYREDVAMAERVTKPAKEPKKTQASQPVNPEQLKNIKDVTSQEGFWDLEPEQQHLALMEGGVSKENAEPISKLSEEKRKRTESGKQKTREENIAFHKGHEKLAETIHHQSEIAKKQKAAVQRQRKNVNQLTAPERLISAATRGTRWEGIFKSKTAQEFDAAVLPMIEGKKETFGVRLSDADLALVLQKIATSEKNPEANSAILDWIELDADMDVAKAKIAHQIQKENGGLRPWNFDELIRERMDEQYGDQIENAAQKILQLSESKTSKFGKKGQKLAAQYRMKQSGKIVSKDEIDMSNPEWENYFEPVY